MKALTFSIILVSLVTIQSFAQTDSFSTDKFKDLAETPDKYGRFMINLNTDIWQDVPDIVSVNGFNPSFGASWQKVFKLNDNFSMAAGIGLSSHSFNSNAMAIKDSMGVSNFIGLDSIYGTSVNFSNNKLSLTYVDVPIEFRWATAKEAKKQFRIAVGGKFGILTNSHTKYRGDALPDAFETTKFKQHSIANISKIRYGVVGRIGYGWINVNVYYSLSSLFEKNKGPEMYPISVGLTAIPW